MYFWLSLAFNLLGAIFAGIQFAKLSAALKSKSEKEYDFSSRFSYILIAFAIPFFSPKYLCTWEQRFHSSLL